MFNFVFILSMHIFSKSTKSSPGGKVHQKALTLSYDGDTDMWLLASTSQSPLFKEWLANVRQLGAYGTPVRHQRRGSEDSHSLKHNIWGEQLHSSCLSDIVFSYRLLWFILKQFLMIMHGLDNPGFDAVAKSSGSHSMWLFLLDSWTLDCLADSVNAGGLGSLLDKTAYLARLSTKRICLHSASEKKNILQNTDGKEYVFALY